MPKPTIHMTLDNTQALQLSNLIQQAVLQSMELAFRPFAQEILLSPNTSIKVVLSEKRDIIISSQLDEIRKV